VAVSIEQLEQDLAEVQTAIDALVSSGRAHIRSFTVGGRSFQYASLAELFALRSELRTQIAQARGPRTVRVNLPRRNRR